MDVTNLMICASALAATAFVASPLPRHPADDPVDYKAEFEYLCDEYFFLAMNVEEKNPYEDRRGRTFLRHCPPPLR